MIEVIIDSVRVSLMTQHRLVILKDPNTDRYLPIWIGPFEADAITYELQEMPQQRPFTHDLIKSIIREMGGRVVHILINDLRNDVFYARLVIEIDGKQIDIDSRPSDAIAVAVRVKAPIYVAEHVMDKAGIEPDEDVEKEIAERQADFPESNEVDEDRLSAFADFVNSLDLEDLDDDDDKK
ncbi:MAG TPA: bifunctional nuclease family protein [Aggregatilineales bacterium]|nr:bifunctional nuclease family protein [Aggregatilineales bacterium]